MTGNDQGILAGMSAELERRKRLHEAEQGLSKRQIVALEFYVRDFYGYKEPGFSLRQSLIHNACFLADEFLKESENA